ncbi:MAG: Crp/Fnr family transcriptional regulator [Proteobacteria bacterium]|nr:Crp/Fnr family transcriptional regulator [Pseudomonadota bacterium]
MGLNEEVELLRKIPLFANVESAKLKLLAFTSDRLIFQEGQALFRQGEVGDAAYLILSGVVRVSINGPNGELDLATAGAHEIIGEIAILCDVPRTANVTAQSEVITLRISKDLFFRLIEEFPQMAIEIMRELAHRLELSNARLQAAYVEKA